MLRVDGDVLRLVGHCGPMPAGDVALHRGTLGGRTVVERRLIHIEDLQNEIDEFPEGSALARERGHRTTLSVPLLKDGAAIGNCKGTERPEIAQPGYGTIAWLFDRYRRSKTFENKVGERSRYEYLRAAETSGGNSNQGWGNRGRSTHLVHNASSR